MAQSNIVKEKILSQLEILVPDSENTEELMLASKAVLDLDKIRKPPDAPPDLDELIRRIAQVEVGLVTLEDKVEGQDDTISNHLDDAANPHAVNVGQTGGYSIRDIDENFSLVDHNHDTRYAAIDHTHSDLVPIERTVNGRSLVRDIDLTKSDIGLTNVHNWGATSDINNPSSEMYATAAAVNRLYELLQNRSGRGSDNLVTLSVSVVDTLIERQDKLEKTVEYLTDTITTLIEAKSVDTPAPVDGSVDTHIVDSSSDEDEVNSEDDTSGP